VSASIVGASIPTTTTRVKAYASADREARVDRAGLELSANVECHVP